MTKRQRKPKGDPAIDAFCRTLKAEAIKIRELTDAIDAQLREEYGVNPTRETKEALSRLRDRLIADAVYWLTHKPEPAK